MFDHKHEDHLHQKNNPHSSRQLGDGLYKGLMIGMVVGAGLVWLFTTEKGKRIRKELQGESNQWLDIAREFLDEEETQKEIKAVKQTVEHIPATVSSLSKKFYRRKKPLMSS